MGIERSISDLPEEILAHIFSFYVSSEGHSELLENINTVCVKWSEVCKSSSLWKSVDDPSLTTEELVELGQRGVLRNTTNLNLRYISISTEQLFQIIGNCDNLQSLGMSKITITEQETSYATENCKNLKCFQLVIMTIPNFDVYQQNRNLRMHVDRTYRFFQTLIEACGRNLVHLSLSNIRLPICNKLLSRLPNECHHLEELHISRFPERLFMYVSEFQEGCPKLRVLEISHCDFNCIGPNKTNGFPHLEVFVSNRCEELGDKELYQLLGKSENLHTLGLNGSQVSCEGLLKIPAKNVEKLLLSKTSAILSGNLNKVISRWKFTLRVLDISLMADKQLINSALNSLWENNFRSPLEGLDLKGSKITTFVLKILLHECPGLCYLNLESCLELPLKLRRTYKTPEDFGSLRSDLSVDSADALKNRKSINPLPNK